MKESKKDKVSFHIDAKSREDFNWLKENDINVSGMIKRIMKEKVAELKKMKGEEQNEI